MNKTHLIIALLFLSACQSTEDVHTAEGEIEMSSSLNVEELTASNPNVKVGLVEKRTIQTPVQCNGRIEIPPSEFISVHAKTVGFIEAIDFLPGDFVKKGARLFSLSNPELIEKQRLISETKAELDQVDREYERQRILNDSQASSLKQFEETGSRRRLLRARYEGLKSELQLIGVNINSLIDSQNYQSRIGIYAIESGYVHEIMVNKGQMVRPEDVLMEMADDDHVHLELQVLSKDASLIELDQKVNFRIAQYPGVYHATVVKVNHMLDERTGTLKVHCHIAEEHATRIKVGMNVQAEIETAPTEVYGLSLSAVVKEGENYFGYVVVDGMLEKQKLEGARVFGDFISFDENEGVEMIVEGGYYIE